MPRLTAPILGLLALSLLALTWWLLRPSPLPAVQPRARVAQPAPAPTGDAAPPAEAEEPAQWPAHAPRTVHGQVQDDTGSPIGGARVSLRDPKGRRWSALSDSEGRYLIREVAGDLEEARFEAAGFEPLVFEPGQLEAQARVRLDATLTALAGLRGQVWSPEGTAAGALVRLYPPGEHARPRGYAVADAQGVFFIATPAHGDFKVVASHRQHGRAELEVWLPAEAPVELVLPGGAYLSGHVVDEAGRPIEAFSLSTTSNVPGGSHPLQSYENPQGDFLLGPVAAGRVRLHAAAEGYRPNESGWLELGPQERREGLVLTLKRSSSLSGRVTDARTGAPIEGAWIVPGDWNSNDLAEMVGAQTDASGHYRLASLPERRNSLHVQATGYRTLMLGGVEGAEAGEQRRDFSLTPMAAGEDGQRPSVELTGVGAILRSHPRGVRIDRLLEGGPAGAQLRAGDVVLAVDGRAAKGLGMVGVTNAIRGEEGSAVQLQILRPGEPEPFMVELVRARVNASGRLR